MISGVTITETISGKTTTGTIPGTTFDAKRKLYCSCEKAAPGALPLLRLDLDNHFPRIAKTDCS
jgi:hypothetical protein